MKCIGSSTMMNEALSQGFVRFASPRKVKSVLSAAYYYTTSFFRDFWVPTRIMIVRALTQIILLSK